MTTASELLLTCTSPCLCNILCSNSVGLMQACPRHVHICACSHCDASNVCDLSLARALSLTWHNCHAGVNKTIRIYRFTDLIDDTKHAAEVRYPVLEISSRSKLSSACFNTYIQQRLAVSDFDGTVQVWDTQNNVDIISCDEHSDRVWSVDCSLLDPSRLLSASMDGTAKLWDASMERSVGTIAPGSQVCTVNLTAVLAYTLLAICEGNMLYVTANVRCVRCRQTGIAFLSSAPLCQRVCRSAQRHSVQPTATSLRWAWLPVSYAYMTCAAWTHPSQRLLQRALSPMCALRAAASLHLW